MSSYIEQHFHDIAGIQGHRADPLQEAAIRALAQLDKQRQRYDHHFWSYLQKPPRNIYLWGPVGRGKSFVMDTFFEASLIPHKKRIHFHLFMQEIRQALHQLSPCANPLEHIADRLYGNLQLLCFDEFHISDIADARTLGLLFEDFIARRMSIVTTSNYHPTTLYPDGLHRELFLPTIDMIMKHFDVFPIDSGQDYRRSIKHSTRSIGGYRHPWENNWLEARFTEHAGIAPAAHLITISRRPFPVLGAHHDILLVDFTHLCGDARSQIDYLALCQQYRTICIAQVPQLGPDDFSIARRFTWFIDISYDNHVQLYINAACPVEALYREGLFASEFERTVSRITEGCVQTV